MVELSLNVLDVIQNSISAGADLIELSVAQDLNDKKITITIKDNGNGMTDKQLQKVTDPFFTTRNTRKVGLGVPLFKMAAEMTGGSFNISSQKGEGTFVEAVFVSSHIDFTPMGDMCKTVVLLISCNPDIDFIYTWSKADKEFILDTRELKQTLGDVPLNTPEIVVWIEDYIRENTR